VSILANYVRTRSPTLIGANTLNKSRRSFIGLVALVELEESRTRYQVLIRVIKSVIETAKYAVDNENMKTITPNKIFWLEECRPFFL
jgi:hypothetical protein